MTDETAVQWLTDVLKSSEVMECLLQDPDDSFGWGKLLAAMWEIDPSKRPCGLLLTGPDGCGKHTAASHMLRLLHEDGYIPVFLEQTALEASSFSEAKELLDKLLDHFYDEGQALCMILEQMEQYPWRQELFAYLGRTLLEYRNDPDNLPPFFLVLIDHQEAQIPALLRGCLRLCRMQLPNEARRRHFLEQHANGLGRSIPMDQLAAATEGVTYSQLSDLLSNLENLLDSRDGSLLQEEWRAFLEEQLPERPREDAAHALARSIDRLLEQLPQLLQDTAQAIRVQQPQAVTSTQPVPASSPATQPLTEEPSRSDVENERVAKNSIDVFGEDMHNQIMNAFANN